MTRHLSGLGFPVAAPRELVLGDPDILVAEYLPADGTEADQPRLGALLDRLHEMPLPPGFPPSRLSGRELLPARIGRRWAEVAARVLANVFLSEAPQDAPGRAAVNRLRTVHAELAGRLPYTP